MRAIVVCLDASGRVIGVDMEGIQECANLFDWREILDHRRARFKHLTLRRTRFAWYPASFGDVGVR